MKLSEIIEKYNFKVYTPSLLKDKQLTYGFCSDLMSDALMILNSVKNQRILEKISRLQYQIDSCTFDHFMKVKTICTKKQEEKLHRLVIKGPER